MPKGDCGAPPCAPVIALSDAMEPIYALPDGGETLAVCDICAQPLPITRAKRHSGECEAEHNRRACADWYKRNKARHLARVALSKAGKREPRRGTCDKCGSAFETSKGGTMPKRCPACRAGRAREPEVIPAPVPAAKVDPWATAAPAWEGPLPGAMLPIDVAPSFTGPEKLGTAIHAILTRILRSGRGHDRTRPEWSLVLVGEQTSSGWAVWIPDEDDVLALRGKSFEATLRGRPCTLTFGARAVLRLKPPRVIATSRHRVRVTAITPVCMRSLRANGHHYHDAPSTPTLWSALCSAAVRIGLALPDLTAIGILRVSHSTESVRAVLNQQRHLVTRGWIGDAVVDVNPLGRWLLEVATRIGLGGRTAYGFGRIAVRDEPAEQPIEVLSPEPWEVLTEQAVAKVAGRLIIPEVDAQSLLAIMLARAEFDHETSHGHEAWRVDNATLIVQPTTLRTLRVIDVVFGETAIKELWEQHAA